MACRVGNLKLKLVRKNKRFLDTKCWKEILDSRTCGQIIASGVARSSTNYEGFNYNNCHRFAGRLYECNQVSHTFGAMSVLAKL